MCVINLSDGTDQEGTVRPYNVKILIDSMPCTHGSFLAVGQVHTRKSQWEGA